MKASVELVRKLNPRRFTAMSAKMAAIVGAILGVKFTEPSLGGISITSDGFIQSTEYYGGVMGRSVHLGDADNLRRNLANLVAAAELTKTELTEFNKLYKEHVDDWQLKSGYAKGFDVPK